MNEECVFDCYFYSFMNWASLHPIQLFIGITLFSLIVVLFMLSLPKSEN